MELTEIISNSCGKDDHYAAASADSSLYRSNNPKPGFLKVATLALGITALTAFNLNAMEKPNPYLWIGGCTVSGFVLGTINYLLFAKPQRHINESLEAYKIRCDKAFWTCTSIHTGAGLIVGITGYSINKANYDKQEADKKKIDDPDNMDPIGPDPFSANNKNKDNDYSPNRVNPKAPEPFKFNGLDLKIDDKTVYLGISGRF